MRHFPVEELRRVLDDLSRLGLDPAAVCHASGVRFAGLAAFSGRIPVEVLAAAFERAEQVTGDAHIGLHAAEHTTLNHLVALVAATQPTLRDGIEQLCRFQTLLFGAEELRLYAVDAAARLLLEFGCMPDTLRHVSEYYVAALARDFTALADPAAGPLEVRFYHAPVGSVADYERVFGCAVRFRAETTLLAFSPRVAAQALPTADPHVARALVRLAADQLQEVAQRTLSERVAQSIRSDLTSAGDASCARIARRLAMSVRTLQRRLAGEGLTFRRLRDAVRREIALELSRDAGGWNAPTVMDLALSVGFSDSATLCRAFKRWTGMSPGAYRDGRDAPLPQPGNLTV
jgi:AraC-like DNA-binding protein